MTTTNLPRDVFLYLLAIITLIVITVSFGVLVFQYINIHIPDVVSDPYFSRTAYFDTIRTYLATLIIVFPVFLWVSRFLRKDILKFPEKRDLKIRKWLLYLTLFIAALVIIGDLVTLLRSFLGGELSQRFIFKVFAILFIAGSVFVHYLSELKDKGKEFKWIRLFDWIVISIVVLGVVAGFFIAGSPQNQRLVRLDEQRINDLQSVQSQILYYWQRKETLPGSLSDLVDPISGFTIPRDPVSGEAYQYSVMDKFKFQLCAQFDTSNLDDGSTVNNVAKPVPVAGDTPARGSYVDYSNVWWHDQGKVCFDRTIDPQLYPPLNVKQ